MPERKLVLFVDDEGTFARGYIEELKKEYEVFYYRTAVDGIVGVEKNEHAGLVVLDIMMPTPPGVSDEITEDGQMTGIWFLDQIRKIVLKRRLPILVLTNRALEYVAPAIADANIPSDLIQIHAKFNTSRFMLPDLVRTLIGHSKNPDNE